MGIGFRELIVLLLLFVIVPLVIWLIVRLSSGSSSSKGTSAAARLAELESLRGAGKVSTDEYEKQRAAIISRI